MGEAARKAGGARGTLPSRLVGYHPGEQVVVDSPLALALAGDAAGWWDESACGGGTIRYPADGFPMPAGAHRCIDLERLLEQQAAREARLGAVVETLLADQVTTVRFLRGLSHGAIRRGISVTTKPGARQLYASGGVVTLFSADDRVVNRTIMSEASTPLAFACVAGDAMVLDQQGRPVRTREVPRLAAVPGVPGAAALVSPPPDTYRVDLLAVAPEDDGVLWLLFLGAPSTVTDRGAAAALATPAIPADMRDVVLPIARVTTSAAHKGIASVEVVAPRFNGV